MSDTVYIIYVILSGLFFNILDGYQNRKAHNEYIKSRFDE